MSPRLDAIENNLMLMQVCIFTLSLMYTVNGPRDATRDLPKDTVYAAGRAGSRAQYGPLSQMAK